MIYQLTSRHSNHWVEVKQSTVIVGLESKEMGGYNRSVSNKNEKYKVDQAPSLKISSTFFT